MTKRGSVAYCTNENASSYSTMFDVPYFVFGGYCAFHLHRAPNPDVALLPFTMVKSNPVANTACPSGLSTTSITKVTDLPLRLLRTYMHCEIKSVSLKYPF